MSDKKAQPAASEKSSAEPGEVPLVTEKVETKSNFAKADRDKQQGKGDAKLGKTPPPAKAKTASKGRGWFWLLAFLLVVAGAAAIAWYFVPGVQQRVSQQLQKLPVIGSRFETATSADSIDLRKPNDSAETTSVDESPSGSISAEGSNEVPPVPEQPTLQPGESAAAPSTPQATSPTPPTTGPVAPTPQQPDETAILREQIQQQNEVIRQLQQQLAGMQRSVTAQGNRLSQIGNASREDWQLAEADYLLRLANQRLMLEQDSRAALGLVQEADKIVRDVDLPDLYGVRQQLARDLTALKLVENVDRDGLYLRLRALEEQMVTLNMQPKFDLATRDAESSQQTAAEDGASTGHFRNSWDNFKSFMKDSIRIRDAEIDPVLLSPQSETRFRQTLRLSMEQAELALLRADETVYKDALNQARELMLKYGVETPQRDVIVRELQELAQQTVRVELPNLSASQSALRNYIDRLHKTAAGQTDGGIQ